MLKATFVIFVSFVICVYFWIRERYRYWEKRKVPYLKPNSIIFGNQGELFMGKKALGDCVQKFYNELSPYRYGGVFSLQNPILYIRDLELAKNILTKDFDYFFDRSFHLTIKNEPLTHHLFNLTGDEWKTLRTKLTPIFSPSRIKMMFSLVQECVDDMISVINESISENQTLEMKDLLARYAIDVISSCAFGLRTNSLRNPESEFRRMGKKTFEMNTKLVIRSVLFELNPQVAGLIGIKSISDEITEFFVNLVKKTVAYREECGFERDDFLNQMIRLKKESLRNNVNVEKQKQVDVEFMAAQCFVFFLAGYETSSNALSFATLEIAKNPFIQKKLQEEVDNVCEKYGGRVTYEALQEMNYLDQVIAETMRKYPAVPMLLRTCTKDYRVPDSDFVIERGTLIYIPIYGYHYDPQYFPQPEKFDPERFSEDGKKSRPYYAYLPFGEGPKICIGMRFGLMELKLALAVLTKLYNFSISPVMEIPVKLKKRSFLLCCEGGIWLDCTKRQFSK